MSNKTLIVITGPTCSGKSTLESALCALTDTAGKSLFTRIRSTTTRARRQTEPEDSYYFVTQEEFDRIAAEGGFAEHVTFNGASYGATNAEIEARFAVCDNVVVVAEPIGLYQLSRYAAGYDYRLLRILLDVPPVTLTKRLLSRYVSDLDEATDAESRISVSDKCASRIHHLLYNEVTHPAFVKPKRMLILDASTMEAGFMASIIASSLRALTVHTRTYNITTENIHPERYPYPDSVRFVIADKQ